MSKLDAALALAAKGFKVFPIKEGAKAPPLLADWPGRADNGPAAVRAYWFSNPNANIGIHCDGLIVVDVDPKSGGDKSFQLLELTDGFPDTYTTSTPSAGHHYYFLADHPVGNSVGVLGPGLDVRSRGGYVLAAGSETSQGEYAVVRDVAVAPAPEWLVERLGQAVPKKANSARLPDAGGDVVGQAAAWLALQPGAVEGQGGDAHTFKVACGLRDRGVSEFQAFRLMLEQWNDSCAPPWNHGELQDKVHNAYRYAENEPGSKAAGVDDFPLIDAKDAEIKPANLRTNVYRLSDFADAARLSAPYVVKGLLERAAYVSWLGAPGEGKSFTILDLGWHVAANEPWMGMKVLQGPVVYLAYEGIGGMRKRAIALRQGRGVKDVPLYIVNAAFNLRDPVGRHQLGQVIANLPEKPVLIVIDTFARALMGGDENSAQDVGAFNTAIASLIESTGACVCVVHHTGKDVSKGGRGSSALLGAIESEIFINDRQIVAKKQRDMELGQAIGFKLCPVIVGQDIDGDEITSCVVQPADIATAKPLPRIAGDAKDGWGVLCDMAKDNSPVLLKDWREACAREFIDNKLTGRFFRLKKALIDKGYVMSDGETVTRRME